MHFWIILVLLFLRISSTTGFLAYPLGTTDTIRNLTCFNGGYSPSSSVIGGMYCVIFTFYFQGSTTRVVYDSIFSDVLLYQDFDLAVFFVSTNFTIPPWGGADDFPKKYGWLRMGRTRCSGFSNTTDVGYGPCTNLPYETFQNGTLCVCATDNCNINITTCMTSVSSYSPTTMIPLFPTFSNPISCFDDGNNITTGYTPYFICYRNLGIFLGAVNISLCSAYYVTHTVVCAISSEVGGFRHALASEDYDSVLENEWHMTRFYAAQWQQINYTQEGYYVNQSATNFLFFLPFPGASYPAEFSGCFCTTNNCNVDMSTCAAGLNYNYSALYGVNTTTPSTVTASSSSGMTNTPSPSTTTALRTSNITTVPPITTAGLGVSNMTTVHPATTTSAPRGNTICIRSNLCIISKPSLTIQSLASHFFYLSFFSWKNIQNDP